MKYTVILTETAKEHLALWKRSGQTKILNKIMGFYDELRDHPHTGTGHVEQLNKHT